MGFGRSQHFSVGRRIAGVIIALAGIVVIADKLPPVFWWYLVGALLFGIGWRLFTA